LQRFEGCRLKAYRCPAGILTIGYGHTSAAGDPQVFEGMSISQDRAEQILARDLAKFERAVENCVTVPLADKTNSMFLLILPIMLALVRCKNQRFLKSKCQRLLMQSQLNL
jgi:GH24 family phage-related lysozyme (muramidase)